MAKLRIAFMGTPEFSVSPLRALAAAGHNIVAIYCAPPKPAGRGHKIQKCAVHIAAEEMGLDVRTPKTMRDANEQKNFINLNLDAAIVVQYNVILPQPILDAPRLGCINIHPSLLPRWRGTSPIKRPILMGDHETGVTIMKLDAGIDTGPILLQEKIPLTSHDTAETLDRDLATMGTRLVVKALDEFNAGKITPIPQPETGVTYAAKFTREDGRIDWSKPAIEIERQVRGLQPWPGCFFMLGDEMIKVLSASVIAGKKGEPGTLLNDDLTIACGKDALKLNTVQRSGKNATDGASFLRGQRMSIGQKL